MYEDRPENMVIRTLKPRTTFFCFFKSTHPACSLGSGRSVSEFPHIFRPFCLFGSNEFFPQRGYLRLSSLHGSGGASVFQLSKTNTTANIHQKLVEVYENNETSLHQVDQIVFQFFINIVFFFSGRSSYYLRCLTTYSSKSHRGRWYVKLIIMYRPICRAGCSTICKWQ